MASAATSWTPSTCELMEQVNASGEVFLSHTRLDDGIALRVAIGNLGTTAADVSRLRELLVHAMEDAGPE